MVKLYHASPLRFRFGDILEGGHGGGAGYAHWNVCMTDSPVTHGSISHHVDWSWTVYEVEPLAPVRYVEGNAEYQTTRARVIRVVGNARSILENVRKRRNPKDTRPVGSAVRKRSTHRSWNAPGSRPYFGCQDHRTRYL